MIETILGMHGNQRDKITRWTPRDITPTSPKKKTPCLSLSLSASTPFSQLVSLLCLFFQRSLHPRLLVMATIGLPATNIVMKFLFLRLLLALCIKTRSRAIACPSTTPLLHPLILAMLVSPVLLPVKWRVTLLVLACSRILHQANVLTLTFQSQ